MTDDPTTTCPKCGHQTHDADGLGFVHCPACRHCIHPAETWDGVSAWVCDICGHGRRPGRGSYNPAVPAALIGEPSAANYAAAKLSTPERT